MKIVYSIEVECDYQEGEPISDQKKIKEVLASGDFSIIKVERYNDDGELMMSVEVIDEGMLCRECMDFPDGRHVVIEYLEKSPEDSMAQKLLANFTGTMQ